MLAVVFGVWYATRWDGWLLVVAARDIHAGLLLAICGMAALLLFISLEFFYYWLHRAGHRVRWFWGNHAVHHSPNHLTLGASFRFGLLGKIAGGGLFFAPLAWLGFDPKAVGGMVSLNLLYQYWLHNTWVPKLGPLEWVLNTPSAHRVHHGANLRYLDANYGGVLIVFSGAGDVLKGQALTLRDVMMRELGHLVGLRHDSHGELLAALERALAPVRADTTASAAPAESAAPGDR